MRFGEPHWLWLLLLLPVLGLGAGLAFRRADRDLRLWCRVELWSRLLPDRAAGARWWRLVLLLLAVAALSLTAARPQIGSRILSVQRQGIDLMVGLDLSESMLAEDLKPNRLTRARQEVQSLIERLRGDRVGLVAFAGDAFVQCPLTLDYAAARMFLRLMDTELIPVPGTAVAEAIRAAARAFDPKERKFKALVLITDGEDHEGDLEGAATEAKEQGVRIFAVGIGTARGEPIPIRDAAGQIRDYKRDAAGEVVMSRLNPETLRRICEETGGRYYDGGSGGLALDRLYAEISGMEQKEQKGGIVTLYEDRYGYFAGAALILLLAEFLVSERRIRRGTPPGRGPGTGRPSGSSAAAGLLAWWILLGAWGVLLGISSPAWAGDSGGQEFRRGHYEEARDAYEAFAREHPEDPRGDYNLGTALHRTGEFGPSEQSLERALRAADPKLRAASLYNLGNTRVRMGDLEGAAEAYEMSLRLRPADRDAKHNLELVRALLQRQPPDSTPQQPSGGSPPPEGGDEENRPENRGQSNEPNPQDAQSGQDQGNPQDQQNEQGGQDRPEGEDRAGEPEAEDGGEQDSPEDRGQQEQEGERSAPQSPGEPDRQESNASSDQDDRASGPSEESEEPPPGGKPLRISPEEARRILDGLAQQEMQLQQERLKARSRRLQVEKDW